MASEAHGKSWLKNKSVLVGIAVLTFFIPLTLFVVQRESNTKTSAAIQSQDHVVAAPTYGALGPCIGCTEDNISPAVGASIAPARTVTDPCLVTNNATDNAAATEQVESMQGQTQQKQAAPATRPLAMNGNSQKQGAQPNTETYRQPTSGYNPAPTRYQQPTSGYKPAPTTYRQPTNAYRPEATQYQQPAGGYNQPNTYQQPTRGYQTDPKTYQQQPNYQKPNTGYQQPNYQDPYKQQPNYQQPNSGYQQQPYGQEPKVKAKPAKKPAKIMLVKKYKPSKHKKIQRAQAPYVPQMQQGSRQGAISGGMDQLMELLMQLIMLIIQLLGGGTPMPATQPGGAGPTPCPPAGENPSAVAPMAPAVLPSSGVGGSLPTVTAPSSSNPGSPLGITPSGTVGPACTPQPGKQLQDLDPNDKRTPWKRENGQPVNIEFSREGVPEEWVIIMKRAVEAWYTKTQCIHFTLPNPCQPKFGKMQCIKVEIGDGGGTDGKFEAIEEGGFTVGGTIKISSNLPDTQKTTVMIREFGRALGLSYRNTPGVVMNKNTKQENVQPDNVDIQNLLILYGNQQ